VADYEEKCARRGKVKSSAILCEEENEKET
jgi:hypothetical protein